MTSLVKTVEMRVLADAGDAQGRLDELDAKAKDLDGNSVKMRFRLDDGDGKAQLDAIQAKADELGFKDVSIKVRVDGAGRAIAELEAVKHEADKARDAGLMDKLFGGGPPLSGEGSLGGGIPVLGSLLGPAGLAIVPAIGAALVEVTGLVSGFAAAGAGAGAFAALAVPAIDKVKAALTDTPAQLKKLGKLSPDEAGAVGEIRQLPAEYKKMSLAFQPQAFKIFNDGLKIAKNLLPAVTPFANTFADSLDKLLKQADKFTQSKGFKQFLAQFHGIEGPAIGAIGDGIGKVAGAVGKLLTTMSGKDVASTITIAFDTIAGAISIVSGVVHRLMTNWDEMESDAKRAAHGVASAFDAIRRAVAGIGHDNAVRFDDIRHGAADAAHNVSSTFDHLRADIHRWADDVVGFVSGHWKELALITGPLGLAIDAISTHWAGVKHAFDLVSADVKVGVHAIGEALSPLGHLLADVWSPFISFTRSAWDKITGSTSSGVSNVKGVLSWFGKLGGLFGGWWDEAAHAVSTGIGKMIGFVETLPGKINSALGGLPGMLFRAGVNAIEGLLHGMASLVGSVEHTAEGWGHDIANALGSAFGIHFSEPSEATLMIKAGQNVARDLAAGMLSGRSAVAGAARQLSGSAGILTRARMGGYGAAGGGDHYEIHIHSLQGSQDIARTMVQTLKEYKRHGGGAPLGIA